METKKGKRGRPPKGNVSFDGEEDHRSLRRA